MSKIEWERDLVERPFCRQLQASRDPGGAARGLSGVEHLLEPSHGPAFWRALECALPDARERKAELAGGVSEVYWCAVWMADG